MNAAAKPPINFLLVDDRSENLVALEALLRRDGVQILTAGSGREALEVLLAQDVALAILDVQMPEMDGFELAELMRGSERSRRVPIIFVTAGKHDPERVFEGYDAGAVDFLHKPVDPRILKNKVETFYQLASQRMELAETLKFHETFVAGIGHDLRNPLNSISMVGQLLSGYALEPKQQQLIARLMSSTKRITAILDQLDDLSRSRLSGGLRVDKRVADLEPTVKNVVEELRLTTQSPIEVDMGSVTRTFCDDRRIGQVVGNLLGNAVKHGKKDAAIRLRVGMDSGTLVIAVHNEGAIEQGITDNLFDPFVSGKKRRGGLGLGLYIVDQIVRAHGGRVDVASTEADGTTFTVKMPAEVPTPERERPSPAP